MAPALESCCLLHSLASVVVEGTVCDLEHSTSANAFASPVVAMVTVDSARTPDSAAASNRGCRSGRSHSAMVAGS